MNLVKSGLSVTSSQHIWFHTLSQRENMGAEQFSVSLKMGNSTVDCVDKLSYLPDPEFLSFSSSKVDSDVQVTIQVGSALQESFQTQVFIPVIKPQCRRSSVILINTTALFSYQLNHEISLSYSLMPDFTVITEETD